MVVLDIDHKNLMFNGYRGSRGVDELTKLVSWVNVECSLGSLLDGLWTWTLRDDLSTYFKQIEMESVAEMGVVGTWIFLIKTCI